MAKDQQGAKATFKADTKDFDDALKQSASRMSEMSSALRLAESQLRRNGESTDLLRTKSQVLQQMVAENAAKQEQLNAKLLAAKAAFGENSIEVDRFNTQLNRAKVQEQNLTAQLERNESSLRQSESAYGKLSNVISKQESELSQLKDEYKSVVIEQGQNSTAARELAQCMEKLSSELTENKTKMNAAEKAADAFDKELDSMDSSVSRAGDGFTVFKGVLAGVVTDGLRRTADAARDLAGEILDLGISYTYGMSEVEALSGASAEEMETLGAKAREMGAVTVYSATDAAAALKYMALAGWDTEQMVGGIAGVLDLASASGMGLGAACDIVTDYLSAFNMEASQSGELADMMAFAQANANLTTEQLSHSWKNCASYLNAGGQSANTVTTMLAMMANQGYKGQEAGTALSAMMRDMTNAMEDGTIKIGEQTVSIADVEGNYRSMLDIVKDVETATNGMSETQRATALATTFTADSTRGLNLLLNAGADKALAFSERLSQAGGSAAEMSATMNDNLKGDLAEMESGLEEVGLQIWEELEEPIRNAAQSFTREVPKMGKAITSTIPGISRTIKNMASNTDDLVTAGVSAVVAVNGMRIAGAGLRVYEQATAWMAAYRTATIAGSTATEAATIATKGLTGAMRANPVGLVVTGVAALVSVLFALDAATDDSAANQNELNQEFINLKTSIEDTKTAQEDFRQNLEDTTAAELSHIVNAEQLSDELSTLADESGNVSDANKARAQFILGELNSALGTEYSMTGNVIDSYDDLKGKIYELIDAKKAEIMLQSQEEAYKNALENKAKAEQEFYSVSNELTEENEKLKAEEDKLNTFYKDNSVSNFDELQKKYDETGDRFVGYALHDAETMQKSVDSLRRNVDEKKAAYDDSRASLFDYISAKATYEAMATAASQGNTAEVIRLYNEQSAAIDAALSDQTLSYSEKLILLQDNLSKEQFLLQTYQTEMAAGNSAFTQQMVDDQRVKCDAAQARIDEFSRTAPEVLASNFAAGGEGVKTASGYVYDCAVAPLDRLPLYSRDVGSAASIGLGKGMDDSKINATNASANVVTDSKNAAQAEVDAGGFVAVGEGMSAGVEVGINRGAGRAIAAAVSMVKSSLIAARSEAEVNSPSKKWRRELGISIPEGTALGVEDGTPLLVEAQRKQIDTVAKVGKSAFSMPMTVNSPAFQQVQYIPSNNQGISHEIDRVVERLGWVVDEISNMKVEMEGQATGQVVTPYVQTEMAKQSNYRRGTGF